jgi:hypothetical protein
MIGNHYEDSCYSFTMERLNLAVAFCMYPLYRQGSTNTKTTLSVEENKIFYIRHPMKYRTGYVKA